ncbi:tetratricopeptide repeat protein [Streptacidiphilus jiangxiensis]|uniref:Tetratricopeptide repeat-containing protein n=1 Tax=Streptacidiphilus jiangxiensis TaxID=235985 RepID=A0A1H7TST3_STRJI|nr:tetratricopeptide repeat protein [Streptacidiphilus jiangxiensis]SEL87559.1 Tetratricopeptide repeat-containing protein [Streptacidiphilus jiangxiensis]
MHIEDVLESAAELLPSSGAELARALVAKGDHAAALKALAEAADQHPAPPRFWEFLTDAAEQLPGEPEAAWYRWRTTEALRGYLRIDLTLTTDTGIAPIPPGRGLQPQWDLGEHAVSSYRAVRVAALWLEGEEPLRSGGRAFGRLLPLDDAHWHNLMPGDVITLRDGDRAVGSATVLDVAWPDAPAEQQPAPLPAGFGDLPLPPPPTQRVRARTHTEHTTWPNPDCPVQVSALIPGLRHRYVRVMRENGSVGQPYPCATHAEFVRRVSHERPDVDPLDPAEIHWDNQPDVWPAQGPRPGRD